MGTTSMTTGTMPALTSADTERLHAAVAQALAEATPAATADTPDVEALIARVVAEITSTSARVVHDPDDAVEMAAEVWRALDEAERARVPTHEPVHAVAFRPAISSEAPLQCASASDDATVRMWQPTIGRMVRIIRGHEAPVFTLAYTPDGEKLFSAGKEGIIRRLDTASDITP